MAEYDGFPLEESYENILEVTDNNIWKTKGSAYTTGVTSTSGYRRQFSIDSIDDIIFTCDKIESATSDISVANQMTDTFLGFRALDYGATFFKDYDRCPPLFQPEATYTLEPLEETKETKFSPYQFAPRHSVFIPRNAPLEEEENGQVNTTFDDEFRKNYPPRPIGAASPEEEEDLFGQAQGSRRHSIASSQNVFACPWPGCSRFFSRAYNLRSHYLIHSGSKPYICEYCGLSFARNHDMRRHLRVHSGEKPYTCSNCDKGFSRQDALTRHRRSSIKCQSLSNFPGNSMSPM